MGQKLWWATVAVLAVGTGVLAATTQMSWLVLLPVLAFGGVMAWVMHSTGSWRYPWAVALGLVALIVHEARGGDHFALVVLFLTVAMIAHVREARRGQAARYGPVTQG